ncbi:MAG: phosphoglycerate kinase [Candidatus Micrarchaeota archaeon]|nr:phosphoglycerate kinase [Candidatus Micrarchaeota archaeon]
MFDGINTLDDVEVKGKTVLVRIDINSGIGEDGKIINNPRFVASGVTIKELASKGAKVVLLAHQGRPGDDEFRSLKEHAEFLSQETGLEVRFVRDVIGPVALDRIKEMRGGDVILLENVRFLAEENLEADAKSASKSVYVQKLAACAEMYVNDAFSVSHRGQASLVGFPSLLPSFAGRSMQRELTAVDTLLGHEKEAVFLLGGMKLKEVLDIISAMCKHGKASKILLAGMPALLFLKAKGLNLGEKNEEIFTSHNGEEFLSLAKELWKNYLEIIATPVDVAVDIDTKRKEYSVLDLPLNYIIRDIGVKTIKNYAEIIKSAKTVFAKGVPGEFEKREFSLGTKELGKALTETKAFTVMGGGAWSTAFKEFNLDQTKISHVSLSGGALLEALSGKKLPGVEALRQKQG